MPKKRPVTTEATDIIMFSVITYLLIWLFVRPNIANRPNSFSLPAIDVYFTALITSWLITKYIHFLSVCTRVLSPIISGKILFLINIFLLSLMTFLKMLICHKYHVKYNSNSIDINYVSSWNGHFADLYSKAHYYKRK